MERILFFDCDDVGPLIRTSGLFFFFFLDHGVLVFSKALAVVRVVGVGVGGVVGGMFGGLVGFMLRCMEVVGRRFYGLYIIPNPYVSIHLSTYIYAKQYSADNPPPSNYSS